MLARTAAAALIAGLGAITLMAPSVYAIGGTSDNGDAYLNDAQRNPRFIEPNGDFDPSRYRASNPQAGYGDRQRSAYGRSAYDDDGYHAPRRPYGRVDVQPYRYVRP